MKQLILTTFLAFATLATRAQTLLMTGGVNDIGQNPIGKLDIKVGGWGNIPTISFNQIANHPSIRMYRPTGDGGHAYPWWIENSTSGRLIFKSGSAADIGSEDVTSKFTLVRDGSVGVGTDDPNGKLDIHLGGWGNIPSVSFKQENNQPSIRLYRPTGDGGRAYPWWIENSTSGKLIFKSGASEDIGQEQVSPKFTIQTNGYVGIGTSNPDAQLAVKGKVHAEEVKVDLNVPGPDYVFEPDYELHSLAEVEAYINDHKHLPEIQSAAEMEKNGVDLGDMNMKLLKKIEELTLYQIDLLKRLEQAEQKINQIEKLKR